MVTLLCVLVSGCSPLTPDLLSANQSSLLVFLKDVAIQLKEGFTHGKKGPAFTRLSTAEESGL